MKGVRGKSLPFCMRFSGCSADSLPNLRQALHLLVEGTALVFLPLLVGCTLSLLRLWSPLHLSLGFPRSHSPAVTGFVCLSMVISTPIPSTIALFTITFRTFLVAGLSRSGTGSPFSMHSAQTSRYSAINAPSIDRVRLSCFTNASFPSTSGM
jgi:hypothetical protein